MRPQSILNRNPALLAALITPLLLFSQEMSLEDLLNPFKQPEDHSMLWYGSGDVDGSGWVDEADHAAMAASMRNDMGDVDGDGIPATRSDRSMLLEYLSGSREYLPGSWNRLRTRDERAAWIRKMLAIDRTDQNLYLENVWDCNEFAIQLSLNFRGYETIVPGYDTGIPDRYDQRQLGRFNLPVYIATIHPKTEAVGHSVNAVLIGGDPTRLFNWLFIDPQTDSSRVGAAERNVELLLSGILRFGEPNEVVPYVILGYDVDPKGAGSMIHRESPLKLPRPDLVVQRDYAPPELRIVYPSSRAYGETVTELRYVLKDASPCRIFTSVDGGATRTGPTREAPISGLQSSPGTNTWFIYALDVFGNESSDTVTFRVYPDSTRR